MSYNSDFIKPKYKLEDVIGYSTSDTLENPYKPIQGDMGSLSEQVRLLESYGIKILKGTLPMIYDKDYRRAITILYFLGYKEWNVYDKDLISYKIASEEEINSAKSRIRE